VPWANIGNRDSAGYRSQASAAFQNCCLLAQQVLLQAAVTRVRDKPPLSVTPFARFDTIYKVKAKDLPQ
jgi:hypothetical protein